MGPLCHPVPAARCAPVSWEGDYIGKPFAEGGRGPSTYDCWGLVRAVYMARLDVVLPVHDEIGTDDHRRVAQQMQQACATGPWLRLVRPQPMAVMVARRDPHSRYPGHVGVMLDHGRVLHVWPGRDVHVSRITEPALAGLIIGYYRHKAVPCPA